MPKSKNQKQKILYIMKFFYEETDEEHTLTVNEIIAKLERNGISQLQGVRFMMISGHFRLLEWTL